MRLKTQENIRKIELLALISSSFLVTTINMYPNMVDELLVFLNQNNITLNELRNMVSIFSLIYQVDVIADFKTQKLTTDYKEINDLYQKVIKNVGNLTTEFGFNDPTEIFAMYVFMYRSGYLSHDKHFEYSINMKDFACLNGVDVIRGTGVCRSISSMLTDIYQEKNMKSTNLSVKATTDSISNLEKICDIPLIKNDDSKKFVKLVMFFNKYIPIPNHLVTMVSYSGKTGIYCPTNDGLMYIGDKNNLVLANNPEYSMKKFEILSKFYTLLGTFSGNISIFERKKLFKLASITEEEYRRIYIETLKLCKENIDILERFYNNNEELYDEIYNKCEKQSGMIKRMVPILPQKRKNN